VNILIKHGANVNQALKSGVTPLQIAQQHGHSDVVSTLITYGADTIDLAITGVHGVESFHLGRSKRHFATVGEVEESEYRTVQ
jgi:ankyrin repeat protein